MHNPLKMPWLERRSQPAAFDGGFSWLSILPLVLSLIAGSTDTIGFLSLNGLFTAHITGNLVVLYAHVINGDPAIISYVLAVPAFALVLLLTRMFASALERAGIATLQALLTSRDDEIITSARKRAIHIFPVILGFGIGCALGAAGQSAYGSWSLALPAGLAALAVAMSVMVRY
jgi:uncharacterized membrane protein YoaK (UPF0700 family)